MLRGLIQFKKTEALEELLARTIPFWKAARPLPQTTDFKVFAEDGFRRNAIVYACITEVMGGASQILQRVKTEKDVELPPTHEFSQLIAKPNNEDSRATFFEKCAMYLETEGNNYIWKRRNRAQRVRQLWTLRPDRVKIVPGRNGEVEFYQHTVEGMKPDMIPAANVIHTKFPDPLDDYYGLSPIAVCARHGDLDNQAVDYLRAFFLNGAAPAGLLKLKNRTNDTEKMRVKMAWRDMYGGQRGWHDLAVLDADAEYEELGSRPEKLRMDSIFDETETRICSVFNVPPMVIQSRLGLQRSTFTNYPEAMRSLWTEAIAPTYDRIVGDVMRGLTDEFGGGLVVENDYSQVEVLQEAQKERRAWALSAWEKKLIPRNQALELSGLSKIDGPEGEEYYNGTPTLVGPDGELMDPGAEDALDDEETEEREDDDADKDEDDEDGDDEKKPKPPAKKRRERQDLELVVEVPNSRLMQTVRSLLKRRRPAASA